MNLVFSCIIRRLLLILLILCSEAVNAIELQVGEFTMFTSLKSINGDDVCAVDISPVTSVGVQSEVQCTGECLRRKFPAKCIGINYKKSSKTCDIFDNDQTAFVVQSGCKYYTTVSVVGPKNVAVKGISQNSAYQKPAFQVTTWSSASASLATDGNIGGAACTEGQSFTGPWWAVDLGHREYVRALNVTNSNYAPERLQNFKTWLSNTAPTIGADLQTSTCALCREYPGFFPGELTAYFNCPLTLPAFQYVIIQGNWGTQPICIEEVRVYTGD